VKQPDNSRVYSVAGPPSVAHEGDLAVAADGSIVGRILAVDDSSGHVGVLPQAYVSQTNGVVDALSARLDELAKGQAVSDTMQEVVAALVAEVNRLEADLARERGEKDLLLQRYIELATKVADHVVGIDKPAVVPSFTESTCHSTTVT